MGANRFVNVARGENAQGAFWAARERAQYEYGHGGYTGTIAEKHDFVDYTDKVQADVLPSVVATLRSGREPEDCEDLEPQLQEDMQDTYDDKWGPAVCLRMPDGNYLFCGYASS